MSAQRTKYGTLLWQRRGKPQRSGGRGGKRSVHFEDNFRRSISRCHPTISINCGLFLWCFVCKNREGVNIVSVRGEPAGQKFASASCFGKYSFPWPRPDQHPHWLPKKILNIINEGTARCISGYSTRLPFKMLKLLIHQSEQALGLRSNTFSVSIPTSSTILYVCHTTMGFFKTQTRLPFSIF